MKAFTDSPMDERAPEPSRTASECETMFKFQFPFLCDLDQRWLMTCNSKLRAFFRVLDSRFGTLQSGQNFTPHFVFPRGHRVVHTPVGHRPIDDLLSFIRTHKPRRTAYIASSR